MNKINKTLKRLIIGILIFTTFFVVVGMLIVGNKKTYLLGLLLGTIVSISLSISMFLTLNKALDYDSDSATKYIRKMAFFRTVAIGVVLAVAINLPSIFNLISVLLGIFTLKLSALAQPFANKYRST